MPELDTLIQHVETAHGNLRRVVGQVVLSAMLRYAPVPTDTMDIDKVRLGWLLQVLSLPDRKLLALPGIGPSKLAILRALADDLRSGSFKTLATAEARA